MLTQEENEVLTRVGPGTPMGELFRRFWIPAALAYGDNPRPGAPKGTLVFDVELLGVR